MTWHERYGVSRYRPIDYLFNKSFGLMSPQYECSALLTYCEVHNIQINTVDVLPMMFVRLYQQWLLVLLFRMNEMIYIAGFQNPLDMFCLRLHMLLYISISRHVMNAIDLNWSVQRPQKTCVIWQLIDCKHLLWFVHYLLKSQLTFSSKARYLPVWIHDSNLCLSVQTGRFRLP